MALDSSIDVVAMRKAGGGEDGGKNIQNIQTHTSKKSVRGETYAGNVPPEVDDDDEGAGETAEAAAAAARMDARMEVFAQEIASKARRRHAAAAAAYTAMRNAEVGSDGYCLPRHRTHFSSSFLKWMTYMTRRG
jgi:hypothetical protein